LEWRALKTTYLAKYLASYLPDAAPSQIVSVKTNLVIISKHRNSHNVEASLRAPCWRGERCLETARPRGSLGVQVVSAQGQPPSAMRPDDMPITRGKAVTLALALWGLLMALLYFGNLDVEARGRLVISAIMAADLMLLLFLLFRIILREVDTLLEAMKNRYARDLSIV